jgi:sulfur-oxidizing protein SoxX
MNADERRYLFGVPLIMAIVAACASGVPANDALIEPFASSGDAIRGREIFLAREGGHCVLCHAVPGEKLAGDVGPSLAGVGSRLSAGQIRLRIADISRVNPLATMPSFHRTEGLTRVAPGYAGKPMLNGQQVEDLVSWLGTLK